MHSCLTQYGPGLSIMGLGLNQYDNAGPFTFPPSPTSRRSLLPRRRRTPDSSSRAPPLVPKAVQDRNFRGATIWLRFELVCHGRSCPRPSGGFRRGRGHCRRQKRGGGWCCRSCLTKPATLRLLRWNFVVVLLFIVLVCEFSWWHSWCRRKLLSCSFRFICCCLVVYIFRCILLMSYISVSIL